MLLEAGVPDVAGAAGAVSQEIFQELAGAQARAQGDRGGFGHQVLGADRTSAQPANGGVAARVRDNFVAQTGLEGGVVVFELGQDAAFALGRIRGGQEIRFLLPGFEADQPAGAALGDQADGAAPAVQRTAAGFLVEVADQNNDALVFPRQPGQGNEGAANALVAAGENFRIEEGDDGIDDHEAGAAAGQGAVEKADAGRQAQMLLHGGAFAKKHKDAAQVGAEGLQARADGVLVAVFGAEVDGAGGFAGRLAVRPGAAGSEPRRQIEHEQRLAQIGIAVDDGDLPEGKTARDQPGNCPRCQLAYRANVEMVVDGVGHGISSFCGKILWRHMEMNVRDPAGGSALT